MDGFQFGGKQAEMIGNQKYFNHLIFEYISGLYLVVYISHNKINIFNQKFQKIIFNFFLFYYDFLFIFLVMGKNSSLIWFC